MTQHITLTPRTAAPRPAVPPAWQPWSAAWTAQVAAIAGRDDLTVLVAPGAAGRAPARFTPADATIEIDANHIDVDPTACDPTHPATRDLCPVGWGMLTHEAAHARHTRWDATAVSDPLLRKTISLLEEARAEAAQLRRRPSDQEWLHAAVTKLVLPDISKIDTVHNAAAAAALLLARVDAGVLAAREMGPVRRAVTKILGRKRLKKLRRLWRRALRTRDDDTAAMAEWARRWLRILGRTASVPLPGGGIGQIWWAAARVIAAIAEQTAEDAAHAQRASAAARAQAAARQAETTRRRAARDAAKAVFGHRQRRAPGPTRTPGASERAAASRLARALKAARFREATPARLTSPTPPGRLNPRQAMNEQVQRWQGQRPTAEPWTRTARRANPRPPLRVGICTDVSWSMGNFLSHAATAGWVIAKATESIPESATASVTFGSRVTGITRPGKAPTGVPQYGLEDATEGFTIAVDALDGVLGLSHAGHAARLLVIISDGEFDVHDTQDGQTQVNRLIKHGCGVLWIAPLEATPLKGPRIVHLHDPAHLGPLIAQAAAALTAAT